MENAPKLKRVGFYKKKSVLFRTTILFLTYEESVSVGQCDDSLLCD